MLSKQRGPEHPGLGVSERLGLSYKLVEPLKVFLFFSF